jgi:CheY-specific phosphatase CheX
MRPHCNHVLERLVSEACVELFSSCGLPVRRTAVPPSAAQPDAFDVAGVIGFLAEHLRGTLVLASTFQTVAASRPHELKRQTPSPGSAADWIIVRDWAAELVNQLLGRVKNRLVIFGVDLRVSTPTALSGRALAVTSGRKSALPPFVYQGGGHELWVWFDADMAPAFELGERRHGGPEAAKEGEILLF